MEREPQPQRIDVEVSDFSAAEQFTYSALLQAERVLTLANAAIAHTGIELVTTWHGHDIHSREVAELADDEGRLPDLFEGQKKRITMEQAAREVVNARSDELENILRFIRYRTEVPEVVSLRELENWVAERQFAIRRLAKRPAEGDMDV